jgi:hypothetical protein
MNILIELVPVGVTTNPKNKETRYSPDFHAMLGERLLCRSTAPFVAAAMVLLAEGVPSDSVLEARHRGSTIVAMRSTVGKAAELAPRYLKDAVSRPAKRVGAPSGPSSGSEAL